MKFHENPSSGSLVVPCGRTDMTKLVVAFRNFAKSQCANENKTNFRSPQRTYNKSTNSIKVFKSMYISPCTCMYTRARWNIHIGLSLHVYVYTCTMNYTYWFVTARVCIHVHGETYILVCHCTCMHTRARWNIHIGLSLHVYVYTCSDKPIQHEQHCISSIPLSYCFFHMFRPHMAIIREIIRNLSTHRLSIVLS